LQGTYFLSDERMTHYTVSNSKGSFVPEEEQEDSGNAGTSPADTTQQEPQAPMRPAARKHAKSTGD
jgi:hypothetical protein